MAYEDATARYRRLYAALLRLYPRPYRERFAEGMGQTFSDLCRERTGAGKGLFSFALRAFGDTFIAIVREHISSPPFFSMYKNIRRLGVVTALILAVPLVAMQFTGEVAWTLSDFVFAGTLIFGTGLAYLLIAGRSGNTVYKFAIGLALAGIFLLTWVNGAVGIIGNENNPLNLLYFAVPVIGFLGAIIARLGARGMTYVLFAMTFVQLLIPMIALMIGQPPISSAEDIVEVVRTLGASAFFAVLFAGSGLMFQQVAREENLLR